MAIVIYGTDRSRIGGGVRYIVARYDDPSRRAEAEHYLSELRQGSSESYSIDYNYQDIKQEGAVVGTVKSDVGDIGIPPSSSQIVVDIETGKNVPYSESKQAQFEINLQKAISEKPFYASQAQSMREQFYGVTAQREAARKEQAAEIRGFIAPIAEELKSGVQESLFARQQAISQPLITKLSPISTIGPVGSYKVGPEFRPLTTEEQRFSFGEIRAAKPGEFDRPVTRTERLQYESVFGTPSQQAKAELLLVGLPQAKKVIPSALGFGALVAISPRTAGIVGVGSIFFSVKGLQQSIAEKGIIRTTMAELPSLALFAGAGYGGSRIRAKYIKSVIKDPNINIDFRLDIPSREFGVRGTIAKPLSETILIRRPEAKFTTIIPRTELEFYNIRTITKAQQKATRDIIQTISPDIEVVGGSFKRPIALLPERTRFEGALVKKPFEFGKERLKSRFQVIQYDFFGTRQTLIVDIFKRQVIRLTLPSEKLLRRETVRKQKELKFGKEIDIGIGKQVLVQKLKPPILFKEQKIKQQQIQILKFPKIKQKVKKREIQEDILGVDTRAKSLSRLAGRQKDFLREGIKQDLWSRIAIKSFLLPKLLSKQKRKQMARARQTSIQLQIPKQTIMPIQQQIPFQETKQEKKLIPILIFKFPKLKQPDLFRPRKQPPDTFRGEPPPDRIRIRLPTIFVTPRYEKRAKRKREKIEDIFSPKYVPSIVAGIYNIFGKKPKRITGLEIRPLIKIK